MLIGATLLFPESPCYVHKMFTFDCDASLVVGASPASQSSFEDVRKWDSGSL